ncbi:DoxX family protein [Rhizobium sp. LjRoot254]|uniref:DoxX family protein n=1 Tax=Rhizobium sp. LjRoot254 TaxID=3342297 RepID=UPI003ED03270
MSSIAMLIGRILLSVIFIQAAISKLMDISGTIAYFQGLGLLLPSVTIWPVILVELVGGLMILTGLYTRIAATVLALFCIATAFIGHSDWSNIVEFQAFMKDIAIAGGLFYVAAAGAGIISLDTRRGV